MCKILECYVAVYRTAINAQLDKMMDYIENSYML